MNAITNTNPCPPVKQQSSHGEGSCLIELVWKPDLPVVRAAIPQTGADLSGPPQSQQPQPPVNILDIVLVCAVFIIVVGLCTLGLRKDRR